MKIKKTNKLGKADNAKTDDKRSPSWILIIVSLKLNSDKNSKYAKKPVAVAMIENTIPIPISLRINDFVARDLF